MTGTAPQPGKTHRVEGNPSASADPEAQWWTVDTAAHPVVTHRGIAQVGDTPGPPGTPTPATEAGPAAPGEAAGPAAPGEAAGPSRAAGPDVAAAPPETRPAGRRTRKPKAQPPVIAPPTWPALGHPATTDPDTAAADAGKPDAATSDKPAPDAATADEPAPDAAAADVATPDTTGGAIVDTDPAEREAAARPRDRRAARPRSGAVSDVMVLPEPAPDRPAAPAARGPVPGQQRPDQPAPDQPAAGQPAAPNAARGRAGQVPSMMAAKLETSPFWLDPGVGQRDPADTTPPGLPAVPSRLGVPPRRVPPGPRRPVAGLLPLLVFTMVAAFFGWVSAEPLWLAVGHGDRGTATVTQCIGEGVTQRCRGEFRADGATFTVPGVALLGIDGAQRARGAVVPARMTSPESRQAFVGGSDVTVHLRWGIGVLLVLLCGLGIAATTGAGRLETAAARRRALMVSLAGPLALLIGFLAVSY